ncbi:MAG TPA: serine/threonine-protein kinase [Polyangiaceae bacterium]|nr:serine/threonine-protein kinase [Polyangiaceae bacterium]
MEPPHDDKEFALPAEQPLPRQFGKYTLLRKLAAGGMAELFLALHRSVAGFEKLIVIKTILPAMNQDRSFIDMLLHEARLSATLSHTNIVQVYDVGQVEGRYFIAMEHIHGEDIRSIIRAMKKKGVTEFPLEHALSIALGVCAGLAYAHEKRDLDGALLNIVHRDISPQNIVITFTGDVKIVDFGIAKSETQSGEDTKSGQLKGKVPYMSPEQAAGEPIDWRSDIFAAGVLLFELTTGKRLFKGASEYETLRLICEKEYPLPTLVKPGYPQHLERIVMRALSKRREDRYQSAREMQSDLEDFIREERIKVSNMSLMSWMQMLFEAKLAQQKEALQDIKQLADIIASQHGTSFSDGGGGTIVTNSGLVSAPGSANTIALPPRRSSAGIVIALMALLGAAAGGFLYLRNQTLAREQAAQAAAVAQEAAKEAAKERPAEVEQAKGSLEIKSSPDGCAIWLNGDLRQEVTPAKIEGLPFGRELSLKLTKEGFETYRETISLTEAAPSRTIDAQMRTGSVTVVLKIDPPPMVWLDNKPWKGKGSKIEGLSADEEHKLVFTANGFVPKTITFVAKQGETKVIEERLVRSEGGGQAGTAPQPGEPKAGGPTAKVRVGSKGGFCNVTINGTSHGSTPVEAVVNPGTVRVSCKPSEGASQSQTVRVNAGDTARVSFKLD